MTLDKYLRQRRMTRAQFAAVIGAHPITVHRWCAGVMRPSWRRIAAIEATTKRAVTAADFVPRHEAGAA
jgi:DNA-binding transcriptional regulator YdaS (Cro superfamily)